MKKTKIFIHLSLNQTTGCLKLITEALFTQCSSLRQITLREITLSNCNGREKKKTVSCKEKVKEHFTCISLLSKSGWMLKQCLRCL